MYGGWFVVTAAHDALPWWLVIGLLAWWSAWHTSLQHELIHGHPFANSAANNALGWVPLNLWIDYGDYRKSHIAHHRSTNLTDPLDDPESFYRTPEQWQRTGSVTRLALRANRTLLGRLTIGPALVVATSLRRRAWRHWPVQAVGVILVLAWVVGVCHMPIALYGAGIYGGLSLTLLRSYAEHRNTPDPSLRSAVVHTGPALSLLFLNNNLHYAHHAFPGVSWHRLPALLRDLDLDDLATSGAGVWHGYRQVVRAHLLRPVDGPVHRVNASPPLS